LHKLVAGYRTALGGIHGIDPVPPPWLHLTMQGIGFTNEVSNAELNAVTDGLMKRFARISPPVVTFARPTVQTEAIYLPATPAPPVDELRRTAYSVIEKALGLGRVSYVNRYRPHVSIAYISAPGPAMPIIDALRQTAAIDNPVTVTIRAASVLTFHRDNQMYEWTSAVRVPIGGGVTGPAERLKE
jgi:hypothetical protein